MKLEALNLNGILRHYLPSIFFIVISTMAVFQSSVLIGSLIGAIIALLLLCNLFLQNKIISRIFGVIFLLTSCYFLLALFSDIAKDKATLAGGYWVGLVLFLFSLAMSILLILSFEKKKQLSEIGKC
jgi:hypothetical protein